MVNFDDDDCDSMIGEVEAHFGIVSFHLPVGKQNNFEGPSRT